MEPRRIEDRVRNYLANVTYEDLTTTKSLSTVVEEIVDLWERNEAELSAVANIRQKIEIVSNLIGAILITQWKNADYSAHDAIRQAVEAELYHVVAFRQRKRKTLNSKRQAYYADVVKRKLFDELPFLNNADNAPAQNLSERRNTNDGLDQISVLRAENGRPSAEPLILGDTQALIPDTSMRVSIQPEILSRFSGNVPMPDVSTLGVAHLSDPADFRVENEMMQITMPEAGAVTISDPLLPVSEISVPRMDQTATALDQGNLTDSALEEVLARMHFPELNHETEMTNFPIRDNIPPPLETSTLVTAEPEFVLPNSAEILEELLPPVRPSQNPPKRKRGANKNLIIDKEISIKNYPARAIELNKSLHRTCLEKTAIQIKYENAMSVARLFSTPACDRLIRAARSKKLENLYSRCLVVKARRFTASRDVAPSVQQSLQTGGETTAGKGIDQCQPVPAVDETTTANLPEIPVSSGITAANYQNLFDTLNLDNIGQFPVEANATVEPQSLRAVSETPTRAEVAAVDPQNFQPTVSVDTTEMPEPATVDPADPQNIQPVVLETPVVVLDAIVEPIASATADPQNVLQETEPILPQLGEKSPSFSMQRIFTEPEKVAIVPEPLIYQPRIGSNSVLEKIPDVSGETTAITLNQLLGENATKRDKITLVRKLLRLNNQWIVRLQKINGEIFVERFSQTSNFP